LLVKFYSGLITEDVLNFKKVPAKAIIDANFPTDVKTAMQNFTASLRTDVFGFIDSGIQGSPEAELAVRGSALSFSSRTISIKAGSFEVKEPYNGTIVRVPYLVNYVTNISRTWLERGVQIPVGGYDERGTITGYIPESTAYSVNEVFQDTFYLHQINPMVEDPTGLYCLSTLTTQKKYTALSSESIVNMVQTMDVELRLISQSFLLRLITPSLLSTIKKTFNDYFLKWYRNEGIENVVVSVEANELDKKNKRVRVTIEVYPTSFVEKILLNFVIR
jgi:hypothetical protein